MESVKMKIKLYRYIGGYGDALDYDTDENPEYYRNDSDYKYVGEWDLPQSFIDQCLPVRYIE
jgi:hypothetical protein